MNENPADFDEGNDPPAPVYEPQSEGQRVTQPESGDGQPASPSNGSIVDIPRSESTIGAVAKDGIAETLYPEAVEESLDRIAANGGAVGAFVLGVWSILGSFLTSWSILNGVIGVLLGVWGLTSRRPRLAWLGIILSIIGALLSMMDIRVMIEEYFYVPEEDVY